MDPETLTALRAGFAKQFEYWRITLPPDAGLTRSSGIVRQAGWTILYRFMEHDGAPALVYFSSHRMTNDTLWRIDAAGHEHLLAAVQDFYVADVPGAEEEFQEHNRAFDALRRSLGLVEPLEDA